TIAPPPPPPPPPRSVSPVPPVGVVSACLPPPPQPSARLAMTSFATRSLAVMRSTRIVGVMLAALHQMVRDHQALDLTGALVDLGDLGIAKVALHRELGDVAVAAEDLDRLARGAVGDIGGVQLGHRRLLAVWLLDVLEPGGAQGQKPRGVDLGRH